MFCLFQGDVAKSEASDRRSDQRDDVDRVDLRSTRSRITHVLNWTYGIRRLIGSFRRLLWVRLRKFFIIFRHLVLILVLES